MHRIATVTTANELAVTAEPRSSAATLLVVVGLVVAVAAFGVVATLARVLAAALTATMAAVGAAFAVLGRTLGVGLVGALVVGMVVFGGADDPAAEVPPPPPGLSSAAPR